MIKPRSFGLWWRFHLMDSAPCFYSLLPALHRKPLGMINENLFFVGHAACGSLVPPPGITAVPWQWKPRVLITGPQGKFPPLFFLNSKHFLSHAESFGLCVISSRNKVSEKDCPSTFFKVSTQGCIY